MLLSAVSVSHYAATVAFFLSSIAYVSAQRNCSAVPFTLPLKDVQVLANVSQSFMKGIPAQVGMPPQDIVLLPWPELNNTWLYDQQTFCDPTVIYGDTICKVRRGNPFLEGASSTFSQKADIVAAGGASQEAAARDGLQAGIPKLVSTSLGGTEIINFADTSSLIDFPVGIPRAAWDPGYSTLHALGLGTNSTYLNALVEAGRISSRVWSIFWGRMWTTNNPIDGSIVLGGYDRKKVLGRNHTQTLDFSSKGCFTGMKVNVAAITANFRDGRESAILPSGIALQLCIVPQRQLLAEIPYSYYDTFEKVTDMQFLGLSRGLHWSASLYDADNVFDGDVTFTLDSGLDIRIQNDQYVVPHVEIDSSGARVFNQSQREVLFNRIDGQVSTLGRYFLTGAYLMVNYDANTFTLWPANPTASSELVPVRDEETASDCGDAVDGDDESTFVSDDTKQHLSSGAIAGIVIGALALIATIVLAALFILRRRRRQRYTAVATTSGQIDYKSDGSSTTAELPPGPTSVYPNQPYHSQQPTPNERPAEIDSRQRPPPVYEMT